MCAPSNMYTTKIRKRRSRSAVLLVLAIFIISSVSAQETKDIIHPIKKTRISKFQYDVFSYVSGSTYKCMGFDMNNSNIFNKPSQPISTQAGFGFNGYINKRGAMGLKLGVGYKHEWISNDAGLFGNNGVNAHWLNTDLNFTALWFIVGISSDVFLGSQLVNKDNFSFEGFNQNCFNRFSYYTYFAVSLRFTRFIAEMRASSYSKPHIDPDKLAYYNFISAYVRPLFLEFRLYYRIYTTGNRLKSPLPFDKDIIQSYLPFTDKD